MGECSYIPPHYYITYQENTNDTFDNLTIFHKLL